MARTEKLDSLFQREISNIIMFELNDPKIGFATVVDVQVASDLSIAKVYVSVLAVNGYEKRDSILALRRSKGYIKTALSKRLKLRKIPDLVFIEDDSLDKIERIEKIAHKEDKEVTE